MDILIGLYNHLSNDEKIKKIVGNKIYPVILPQNVTLPAIVYSSVLANYDSALQGDTGFVRQTIQIVSHAKTYKEAQSQVSMITIIAMIPMFISILGLNIDTYYYLIPICNFEQILNDLFTNNLTFTNTFITLGSSIVYITVVITYIIKAYNSEKTLFNN